MLRIGILGANGQVGTEICLLLKLWPDVEVTAFCRNPASSVVLRRLGIECVHGDVSSQQAGTTLSQMDAIVDFALPQGSYASVVAAYRRIYASVFAGLPKQVAYVLASSQMALGFGGETQRIGRYWFPRTVYGATKRFSERCAKSHADANGNPLYILRLAQVHGLIQGCSLSMKQIAQQHKSFRVYAGPSYTVFCYTIAEAIVNIARGIESTGTYTLDSSPPWTWMEVLNLLANREIQCHEMPPPVRTSLSSWIGSSLQRHKEPVQANVLKWFPRLESKLRYTNRRNQIRSAFRSLDSQGEFVLDSGWGKLPGRRLIHLTDSRQTMQSYWDKCAECLKSIADA